MSISHERIINIGQHSKSQGKLSKKAKISQNSTVLRDSADTCVLTPGCCKKFTRDEIFEILKGQL